MSGKWVDVKHIAFDSARGDTNAKLYFTKDICENQQEITEYLWWDVEESLKIPIMWNANKEKHHGY